MDLKGWLSLFFLSPRWGFVRNSCFVGKGSIAYHRLPKNCITNADIQYVQIANPNEPNFWVVFW
jgi:hypothetical protein